MALITATQQAGVQEMIDRYDAAVAAGQRISDKRVHLMYRSAKYVIANCITTGTDASLQGMTPKQVVEFFANSALVE